MIYLKSIVSGIIGSIFSVIIFGVIVAVIYRHEKGMVGINILGLLPLTVAVLGFAAGFYLVFRNSN